MTVAVPMAERIEFELTTACDHRCAHCYNVWGRADGERSRPGPLDTRRYRRLIEKVMGESGATHATLTGGEPLLRHDADELIAAACGCAPSVSVVTNGSHLSAARARRLRTLGVRSVQLTLLSSTRERHDALKGTASFDDTLRAALDLRDAHVPVSLCFVALRVNEGHFAGVLEMAATLGVRLVSYNRMAPSGGAVAHVARLMPTARGMERDLAVADRLGPALGIRVVTAMPIPPCVVPIARFPSVRFGFCSLGTARAGFAVGANGQVRPCNLSPVVLGDAQVDDFRTIVGRTDLAATRRAVPMTCRGCAHEATCAGGCKESARAVYGDPTAPEPILRDRLAPAWRETAPIAAQP